MKSPVAFIENHVKMPYACNPPVTYYLTSCWHVHIITLDLYVRLHIVLLYFHSVPRSHKHVRLHFEDYMIILFRGRRPCPMAEGLSNGRRPVIHTQTQPLAEGRLSSSTYRTSRSSSTLCLGAGGTTPRVFGQGLQSPSCKSSLGCSD